MGFLNAHSTLASAIQTLIGVMNMLVSVLAALALVVFFIGLVRYVRAAGDSKAHSEGRERIFWSMVALFILFSIWGILNLLSISFFGTTNLSPGSVYMPSQQSSGANPFNTTGSLY